MFSQITDFMEKRQARGFLNGAQGWYYTCIKICELLGDALYDEAIGEKDIGVVLDKVDRMLFALRNEAADVRGFLRRQDRVLAERVENASTQVYELRNETTRFLMRCQGPGPVMGKRAMESQTRMLYYYRALEEAGFQARQVNTALESELKAIWRELQRVILVAEQTVAG